MSNEREQNKKINQHTRQIVDLQKRVKTLELDVDAGGRISEAFDVMDSHIDNFEENVNKRFDRIDSRLDRLERDSNEIKASLNVILEHIIGVGDLPEE